MTRVAGVVAPLTRHNFSTTNHLGMASSPALTKVNDRLHPFFSSDFRPRGFDEFFRDPFFSRDPFFASDPMQVLRRPTFLTGNSSNSVVGYDIHESDESYQISVDVPGVKINDLKVEVEGDDRTMLKISGGRKTTNKETGIETVTRFEKRFMIGDNVDMDKLTANLEDGVLVLTAPKIEKKQVPVRTIEITEGGGKSEPVAVSSGSAENLQERGPALGAEKEELETVIDEAVKEDVAEKTENFP